MLRRLYDRTMALAEHKHALPALAGVSFVESSFFPIPPDVMIVPMVLAKPERAWLIAGVCLVASVLGGIAGYALGYYAFEWFGQPMLEFYGYTEQFAKFQAGFAEYGVWAVALFGLSPLPYKVITIASGLAALNPVGFIVASILSRGVRFFAEAALLKWVGPPIREFVEKRLGLVATVFLVFLFGGFLAIKYL